jgi:integral membrane protein (TIGR01906 family)
MLKRLLIFFIALSLPFLLVVTSIRILANEWFVNFEYSRPNFPPDPFGFTPAERTPLAMIGLHSVLPDSEGMILLERATLPDGSLAFNAREIKHMTDVRILIGKVYPIELMSIALIVILAIVLNRSKNWRDAIPDGLRLGSILTLSILGALIAYLFINFDALFLQFHKLFFEGDTFAFQFSDTLIRLYPVQFWNDAFIAVGAMTVVMSLIVWVGSMLWLKKVHTSSVIASPEGAKQSQ